MSSTPDYSARIQHVRDSLREPNLDALLVMGPANRRYLSGYTAHDGAIGESAGAVLVMQDRAILLVNPLYTEQASAEGVGVETVELRGRTSKALAEKLSEWSIKRLGFERDYTVYGFYEDLQEQLDGHGELVSSKGIVEELRLRKSPAELEILREAARIADEAYGRVVGALTPGKTELEVARALNEAMVELGAEGPSFPTIVAAGLNSARPHHEPGETVLDAGMPVVIDMGARYHGYCSDMTRSFALQSAEARYTDLHSLVLRAHLRAEEAIRDGLPCKEADAIARQILSAAGYEREFNHSLGHGVGMDVHEPPRLHKDSDETLASGMVVSVEPGVYIGSYGGVRIEDTVVVTDSGSEILNHSPKDPIV